MISLPVRITVDPPPVITISAASTSVCVGDPIVFTGSGGLSYEFFLDNTSVGTSVGAFSIPGITDQQAVYVRGVNAQGCFADSSVVTITVNPAPSTGSINSGLVSNTMCSGDFPIFTATGGATYEFFVNGVQETGPQVVGNIFNTVTDTTILNDGNIVSVRIINGSGCSQTVSLTIRVNGFTGTNVIGSAQNICLGDTPAAFTSTSTPTVLAGAVISYQWQSREIGDPFNDITIGGNNETFAPSSITTTTDYLRKVISTLNGVPCEMISLPVRITFDGAAPINPTLSTDSGIFTFCTGEDVGLVASSTGGVSYTFYSQGILLSGPSANTTMTALAGTIQNLDVVSVIITAAGGCSTTSSMTLFENIITTNGLLTPALTSVCLGDPSPVINGPTSVASGVVSYEWTISSDNVSFTTISGANSTSYNPGTLFSTTFFKRRTISLLNGVTCESIYTPSIAIQVDANPILTRTTGGPLLQQLCTGDPIAPISYEFGGITSSVQIRNLGANLIPVMVGAGTVTPLAGPPTGWYNITSALATSSFTISGNIINTSVFDVVTILPAGSACSGVTETYSVIVSQPAVQPDFIRMDVNQPGYEVLSSAMSNTPAIAALAPIRWYNNTVCQDRLPAPTTASTEFFTCYIDNRFNQQSNTFEFAVTPPGAGNMINNNFQRTTIQVNAVAALVNGQNYTVTITTASGTITPYQTTSSAATQTADLIGLDLANKINIDPEVSAIYNNVTNQIIIEAAVANTAFIATAAPVGPGQSIQLVPSPNPQPQITRSGTMQWDQAFNGPATISVRSVGCGGTSSPWTSVQIDVIPEKVPADPVSDLNAPIALDADTCSGGGTGPIPECQIDVFSLPTQFFASSVLVSNVLNDYNSLEWRFINIAPAAGSAVASPGTIAQATGIITWNIGWFGVFDLQVRANSCDNVLGNWSSTTVTIGATSVIPSISVALSSALPECPIPPTGFTTLLESNQTVNWYVNSLAGLSSTTTFINTATLQLTPEASNDLLLDFQPGYSGNVIITAEPDSCPGSSATYIIQVPQPPTLTLTSAANSNLQIGATSVCINTNINSITYNLEGAADTFTITGLPNGVNAAGQTIPQSTILNFSNTGVPFSANQVYTININNSIYSFTTSNTTTSFDDVAEGLRDVINILTTDFVASYTSPSLSLEVSPSGRRGDSYIIARSTPFGNSVAIAAPLVTVLQKTITISGSPIGTVIPGLYNYVITTVAPAANCAVVSSTGTIEIEAPATISVISGIANNVGSNSICNGSSFFSPTPLTTFKIQNAGNLIVGSGTLPNGLTLSTSASGSIREFEIVGQINETVVVPTIFTATLVTVGAVCSETSIQLTIEVEPSPVITPADPTVVNQTECSRSPIDPIRFEVFNPAFGLGTTAASVFPNGVTGQLYQQAQLSQFQVNFTVGAADTTLPTDTFTFNINNTLYTYTATETLNFEQLASRLNTFLTAQLPAANYNVLYVAGTNVIQIQALNPGIAFDISSSDTSAALEISNTTIITPPAYYEISGTPSVTLALPTDYIYELITTGPSCIGSSVVSGTITINPNTYGTYLSGDANPVICDNETIGDIVFSTVGAISAAIVTPTTPSWVSVNFNSVAQSVTISTPVAPSLNITQTTVYNYQINLIGSIYGCTDTPTPIQGTITVSPIDQISHIITSGSQTQNICVAGNPLAITPIVYQLSGGSSGATVTGLPPGITSTVNIVSNTLIISGTATQIPSSTFTYNYNVITTPAACVSATANGSITVFSQPELTLVSSATSNSQIGLNSICDQSPIETIIYEYSPTPSTMVNFTWTGSNSLNGLGVTASVSGTNQFAIQGTPSTGVTQTTIYTYQIETVGSNCIPEVVLTGSIAINPVDSIVHIPASGPETQTVCVNDQDNPLTILANNFVSIEYQLGGGATSASVIGLPPGLNPTINIASNTLKISGIVNLTATPTVYPYIITTSGACVNATANGSIEVLDLPTLVLTTPSPTINQTGANAICESTSINTIIYEMGGGATGFDFTWLGSNTLEFSGLSAVTSGTQFIISGIPTTGATQTIIYTYQLTTIGSACAPEIALNGSIEITPNDLVVLTSAAGTDNQNICVGGLPAANALVPITYELLNGAKSATITGLPPGVTASFNSLGTILTINGTAQASASLSSLTITPYIYTITTIGCSPFTINGNINVIPKPEMNLVAGTLFQEPVCNNTSIIPVEFQYNVVAGGGSNPTISWPDGQPNGITGGLKPGSTDTFIIQGIPSVTISSTTTYRYNVTYSGICDPDATFSGSVGVIPTPIIDTDYIIANDVTNVTCFEGNDGSIIIPDNPLSEFEKRITGGLLSQRQIDEIRLSGTTAIGDIIRISFGGKTYSYTVKAAVYLSPTPEDFQVVSNNLSDVINNAVAPNQSYASAVPFGSPTLGGIRLTADVGGIALNTSVNVAQTANISNTIITTQINRALNYSYSWTGPNSFTSSNLSISNLLAGDYFLTVDLNGCSVTSIEIPVTAPPELQIAINACGGLTGSFEATITGGTPPYTLILEDDNGIQIGPAVVSNGGQVYTGLAVGDDYILEVTDATCNLAVREPIEIPTQFLYSHWDLDDGVTDSYCSTSTFGAGNGSIILTRAVGGTFQSAFSGGSNQFSYSWTSSTNAPSIIGVTANITNLPPDVYTVTVTDIILGCSETKSFTVGGYPELKLNPILIGGLELNTGTTSSTADFIYKLTCNNDNDAVFSFNASGGNDSYTITPIAPPGVTITNLAGSISIEDGIAGIYTFTLQDAGPDGLVCDVIKTVEVINPSALSVVEILAARIDPTCPGELGHIEFAVFGGKPNGGPYTVTLNGGQLVGTSISAASTRVIFSNIDTSIINLIDPLVEIKEGAVEACTNNFTLPSSINLNTPQSFEFETQVTDIDCSTSPNIPGSIIFNEIGPDTFVSPEKVQIRVWRDAVSFNIYKAWGTNPNSSIQIFLDQPGIYNYEISATVSCTSPLGSGVFEVQDIYGGNYLDIKSDDVTQVGCENDVSIIALNIVNIQPPLTINWFEYKAITTVVTSSVFLTGTPTTSFEWVILNSEDGKATVSGLDEGIYKAEVFDANINCIGIRRSNTFILQESSIQINNFKTVQNNPPTLCDNYATITYNASFNISANLNRKIRSNAFNISLLSESGSVIPMPPAWDNDADGFIDPQVQNFLYVYPNLLPDRYSLIVEERFPASLPATSTLVACSEIFFFEVQGYLPITFTGQTSLTTDICTGKVDIVGSASGGVPIIRNGLPTYNFEWSYTPADPKKITQFRNTPIWTDALPGSYCVKIIDENGCFFDSCDSSSASNIEIIVEDIVAPFTVTPLLVDPDTKLLVKSLPPDCESGGSDGKISVKVSGGLSEYEITWSIENPSTLGTYDPLPKFTGYRTLTDLEPGNYKMMITTKNPSGLACSGSILINNYLYHEEIIQVTPNRQLYIIKGPFVDEDLCSSLQGKITVDIFDNNDGDLTFYYNNIMISSNSVTRVTDRKWSVAITNAVEKAELKIVNEDGCLITEDISRGIGVPNFEFTSPNYVISSSILAREEATFLNTSTDPFVTSEWIFGDNSPPVIAQSSTSSITPIRHAYGVSGTYFATLRIYNSIGCSEEVTQPIIVGRGYNIMVPNVFTPNNDLVNDKFRPLFSGFSKMTFSVYDYRGNVIYNEFVEEANLTNITGISVSGWDGALAPYSPYYIFTASGVLLDGDTVVEKSGTFILIN